MKTYDFGSGRTDPASFPVAELAAAAQQGIEEVGTDFVNYPGELGHLGLREIMAMRETKREGIEVSPDHLTLPNGSFQGVTMVAEALMERPGEIIVTEELTYSGTIGAYKRMGAQLVGVPLDDDGGDPEQALWLRWEKPDAGSRAFRWDSSRAPCPLLRLLSRRRRPRLYWTRP